MNPVIRHLSDCLDFPQLEDPSSLSWTFTQKIQTLGPDFYSKLMTHHPIINIEYSVLCQHLKYNLSLARPELKDQILKQLVSALMIAEVLEHLYHYYLNVPREVVRLRGHQKVYKELLSNYAGYDFPVHIAGPVEVGYSFSQVVRDTTMHKNWYRLLIVRMKRLLDLVEVVGSNSPLYKKFVEHMDRVANPILPYVAWLFLTPRLLTNLFLMVKHTIPGPWMDEDEKAIKWTTRLQANAQRRWFELGNDSVWVLIGIVNCFIFLGPLAPIGIYINVAFFGYDVILAGIRATIELTRLYNLRHQYTMMIKAEQDKGFKEELIEFSKKLNERIKYEEIRLSINVISVVSIFFAMCFALPLLAFNPLIPFIGAIWLVSVSVIGFILAKGLEEYKPLDSIDKTSGVIGLGFFSKPKVEPTEKIEPLDKDLDAQLISVI